MTGRGVRIALGVAVAAGLGVVVATVAVGARLREETVVEKPYEEGLGHDAERRARAALGLAVRILDEAPVAGAAPIAFVLEDAAGLPVREASVTVGLSRPETSRDARSAAARPEAEGRWVADLAFPAPGPWEIRFDVRRGTDRVRLERRVAVAAPCDLGARPCTRALAGGGEVTLELSPRPLETVRELRVRVDLRGAAADARASVAFSMSGMDMGENRRTLAPAGPGRHEGTAVLVRCPSGGREWVADVSVSSPGEPPRTARFPFTVER